jgi:tryptophanyl-tRNA synthetase
MSKKIITGIKSTGSSLHLGNLMGAVLPLEKVSKGNDTSLFIADLHSLTSVKDGDTLRHQTFEIAVEYFAILGLDTDIRIFRQSDIRDITKLMWILTNVTPYSLMNRAHSFKDQEQKIDNLKANIERREWQIEQLNDDLKKYPEFRESIDTAIDEVYEEIEIRSTLLENAEKEFDRTFNMGVYNYPILMAADIIGYDIEAVPVGKDQIQHLEMARDIARSFNKTYGKEVFPEPVAIVTEELATLPWIDGRKMSKSYDNFIGVFDDEKTLKKRIMSITTDSKWVDDVKDPDTCNVFALYKVFASLDQTEALRTKYLTPNAGFGYGHAKTALLEVLSEYLRPYREAREKLLQNPEIVEAKLREWAIVMNARLEAKMEVVKRVVGVN